MTPVTKTQRILFRILALHFYISIGFSFLAGLKRQILQILINRKTIAANNRNMPSPDDISLHEQNVLIKSKISRNRSSS